MTNSEKFPKDRIKTRPNFCCVLPRPFRNTPKSSLPQMKAQLSSIPTSSAPDIRKKTKNRPKRAPKPLKEVSFLWPSRSLTIGMSGLNMTRHKEIRQDTSCWLLQSRTLKWVPGTWDKITALLQEHLLDLVLSAAGRATRHRLATTPDLLPGPVYNVEKRDTGRWIVTSLLKGGFQPPSPISQEDRTSTFLAFFA